MEEIEIVSLSDDRLKGLVRVIQVDVEGKPFIVFGAENQYHREVLSDFLDQREIPYETIYLGNNEGPASRGERYELRGAGIGGERSRDGKKALTFTGNSRDYRVRLDTSQLELLAEQNPELKVDIL